MTDINQKNNIYKLLQSEKFIEAKIALQDFCQQHPMDPEAWFMLGALHGKLGEYPDAEQCCIKAAQVKSDHAPIYYNMGISQLRQKKLHDAEESLTRALELAPQFNNARLELANVLHSMGNYAAAQSHYELLLDQDIESSDLYNNIGLNYYSQELYDEALDACQKSVSLDPDNTEAFLNLGNSLQALNRMDEALEAYNKVIELEPAHYTGRGNRLFLLNYMEGIDPYYLYNEHILWARLLPKPGTNPTHGNNRDPDKKLRIGYVSPDFRKHSVAFFFEPLLAGHSHSDFEIYCYSASGKTDSMTSHLRTITPNWRDVSNLEDKELEKFIRADEIDILVDLAGHTNGNRLRLFSLKPAPLQITYLGYPNTTGLTSIDYRITDTIADPDTEETDNLYSEKLVRVDGSFLCYTPPQECPPLAPPPCLNTGHTTFGSFNNLAKVTPSVIRLWASILKKLRGSRLILKNKALSTESTRKRYLRHFLQHGIEADRIELIPFTATTREHLDIYSRIDIALDTFPYNGTTTTCEALWMGVPVISLAGNCHASRVGLSILTNTGLKWLAVKTETEYLEMALKLATCNEASTELRGNLRQQLSESVLCDPKVFARKMEIIYRNIWEKWSRRN